MEVMLRGRCKLSANNLADVVHAVHTSRRAVRHVVKDDHGMRRGTEYTLRKESAGASCEV